MAITRHEIPIVRQPDIVDNTYLNHSLRRSTTYTRSITRHWMLKIEEVLTVRFSSSYVCLLASPVAKAEYYFVARAEFNADLFSIRPLRPTLRVVCLVAAATYLHCVTVPRLGYGLLDGPPRLPGVAGHERSSRSVRRGRPDLYPCLFACGLTASAVSKTRLRQSVDCLSCFLLLVTSHSSPVTTRRGESGLPFAVCRAASTNSVKTSPSRFVNGEYLYVCLSGARHP